MPTNVPFSISDLTFRSSVQPGDEKSIGEILKSTGFFYDIEIPVGIELVEEKLIQGAASSYQFLFALLHDRIISYSCYGLIPGTVHSFDLYWIATHQDFRGGGIGKKVLEETHRQIVAQGGLNVIAETSSLPKYAPTRGFYEKSGYREAGYIADFYTDGDAKVIYVKRLPKNL